MKPKSVVNIDAGINFARTPAQPNSDSSVAGKKQEEDLMILPDEITREFAAWDAASDEALLNFEEENV